MDVDIIDGRGLDGGAPGRPDDRELELESRVQPDPGRPRRMSKFLSTPLMMNWTLGVVIGVVEDRGRGAVEDQVLDAVQVDRGREP